MGGGFALLTGTGTILAGFGGLGGLPLIAAGTLGVLGENFFFENLEVVLILFVTRIVFSDVYWPHLLQDTCWPVL